MFAGDFHTNIYNRYAHVYFISIFFYSNRIPLLQVPTIVDVYKSNNCGFEWLKMIFDL